MSVCEVNDPTLAYVHCLKPPLLFWLAVGVAPPESDEAAISEAHCEGACTYRGLPVEQPASCSLEPKNTVCLRVCLQAYARV